MEEPHWLRIVTIGLVLAAMAVGYFLISGRLSGQKSVKSQAPISSPSPSAVLGQAIQSSPSPLSPTPSASPSSAYNRIVNRTIGDIQTLPQTGTPVFMLGFLSASAMIVGWGLRKYPY